MGKRKPARVTHPTKGSSESSYPVLSNPPDLPVVPWSAVGQQAPTLLPTPSDYLPEADAVVVTWADAEWAAMEHVFVTSGQAMPYSEAESGSWEGWQTYDKDMPYYKDWDYWGQYRLVQIGSKKVLLFKSNTHLDWPGESYLVTLIERILEYVKPSLLLSIGTAGGARTTDALGTVNMVNAGTLYEEGEPASEWPVYANAWTPDLSILEQAGFSQMVFPVPTTQAELESLATQFNAKYGTDYSLSQLNADGLDLAAPEPAINNLTPAGTSLLTTSSFVVGTTAGTYAAYACIEMDDAILGKVADQYKTPFGFVRNVSDPVQNADLPAEVQGNWGEWIYDAYGFYTSYNGALAAWALLAA